MNQSALKAVCADAERIAAELAAWPRKHAALQAADDRKKNSSEELSKQNEIVAKLASKEDVRRPSEQQQAAIDKRKELIEAAAEADREVKAEWKKYGAAVFEHRRAAIEDAKKLGAELLKAITVISGAVARNNARLAGCNADLYRFELGMNNLDVRLGQIRASWEK